jgi:hypothetical protein
MMRAMMSVLLPAGNGTTRRIGRCGHAPSLLCPAAPAASASHANMIEASRIILEAR